MTKRKVTDLLPTEAILISSDEDMKVLKEFEKVGAKWAAGYLPTNWNPTKIGYGFPFYLFGSNYCLVWADSTDRHKLPATDFIQTESDEVEVDKFDRALKLLKDLADLQNGAPIEQHRTEWEQTMDEVYTFLNQHKTRNTPNQ